jgi:hypothetical protein
LQELHLSLQRGYLRMSAMAVDDKDDECSEAYGVLATRALEPIEASGGWSERMPRVALSMSRRRGVWFSRARERDGRSADPAGRGTRGGRRARARARERAEERRAGWDGRG